MRMITREQNCVPRTIASHLTLLLAGLATANAIAADPFASSVRPTDPLSAAQQQKSFRLPKGFSIQLFASEPDIQKPINMAFDASGRLWVSGTIEYPFAAKPGRGRDTIRVLEDTDRDGQADRITTFADGLNIPIGLYPYRNGVVVYSIPDILFLQDTDGDGKADRRDVLYGPLGTPRDVHGLQNGFRRGFDGWLYICHGFSNESTIRGTDGSSVTLQSGNTYRVRLDGSRVEQFTWGQVNPFGMARTPGGDLFTADCHSNPLSLLLRGGYYSSFGKPHDGLGFVKPVMDHGHGSTAISGAAYYTGTNFPAKYRGNLFVGNVMTSRIDRDSLTWQGSTARVREEADFVTTTDPWFRPVDIQLGPDGALYIADFYNRIIGHYEVPLDHPGRDRKRGRIWRVSYTATQPPASKTPPPINLAKASIKQLIQTLKHPNLINRLLATDQLSDRFGHAAIKPLTLAALNTATATATARVHALWVLHRLGQLPPDQIVAAAKVADPLVRTHAMKLLSESTHWSINLSDLAVASLNDPDGLVRRAAADALGQHADHRVVRPLLDALARPQPVDAHFQHVCRIALRNQLRAPGTLDRLRTLVLSDADNQALAAIALAVPSEESGTFLVDYLQRATLTDITTRRFLAHAAKFLPAGQVDGLVEIARQSLSDDLDLQLGLLSTVEQSLQQRGLRKSAALNNWGRQLASQLLDSIDPASAAWGNVANDNPWGFEIRRCADGKQGTVFLTSLTGGEDKTGTLRSRTFTIPDRMQFYICGHLGFPNDAANPVNFARLRLVESDELLRTALPPRSDIAQLVDWKLNKHSGQQGYLELVDGLDIKAFAWVAVARFDPPVVTVPSLAPTQVAHRLQSAATIAGRLGLKDLASRLMPLVVAEHSDRNTRAAAAQALASFQSNASVQALASLVGETSIAQELRNRICRLVAQHDAPDASKLLAQAMQTLPTRLQSDLAETLAASRPGGETLLELIEQETAPARLLRTEAIRQKLLAARPTNVQKRIEQLTASLVPIKQQVETMLAVRHKGFESANPSISRGRQQFLKQCATCHQVQGRGAVVGPQLDGIGNRGLERIFEDVLDPNRNVDVAFQTSIYVLESGRVVTGLFRRREGQTLVVVDNRGKETRIAKDTIDEQTRSKTSIMPDDVAANMKPTEFYDLAAYLLSLRKAAPTPVVWQKTQIDARFRSEGVAVADVNRDGANDVLVGELWYEAPDWKPHEIAPLRDNGDGAKGYSANFLCFADDINRDQWPDLIVIGFPGTPCHWYENPRGKDGHWKRHRIWHSACNETPLYTDLLRTGRRVLVMGWQPKGLDNQGQLAWFEPQVDASLPWTMHPISRPGQPSQPAPATNRFSHGLGTGDINGDGRHDVISTAGWWEQPATRTGQPWPFHPATLGPACANMVTTDVDGDGQADVITSSAHQFGIWWHRQQPRKGADPQFVRNELFPDLISQTHALHLHDIDQDGQKDLVTGKRWWAHGPTGDPGSNQPAVLYWFQAIKQPGGTTRFVPRLIDRESGIGTQFWIGDLNKDNRPDIVTSNKRGVVIFEQSRLPKGQ